MEEMCKARPIHGHLPFPPSYPSQLPVAHTFFQLFSTVNFLSYLFFQLTSWGQRGTWCISTQGCVGESTEPTKHDIILFPSLSFICAGSSSTLSCSSPSTPHPSPHWDLIHILLAQEFLRILKLV